MEQEAISSSLIGAVLRDEREAQKLSVEEVALRLRLSEKQINALESDDFSLFGSAIFARGFIKSYARLLTLDPQSLLDAHLRMFPQDQSQSISYKADEVVKPRGANFSKFASLISAVLLIITVIIWVTYKIIVYQSSINTAHNQHPEVNVEQNSTSEPLPGAPMPATELQAPANKESIVTEISLPKAKEVDDIAPKAGIKLPADITKESTKVMDSPKADSTKSETAQTQAAETSTVRVKLLLSGSSWIGVQDKYGKTVFSKLAKAGTEEYVEGVPPLKFHIGNASATQVIFNGETIDLAPITYNNMARLTVGEN